MIDPKELRIGNWISCYDIESESWCVDQVAEIRANGEIWTKDEVEGGAMANDQIKGIELTEEWLVKFGFEKNGDWVQLNFNPRMGIRYYNGNSAECDIIQDDNYIAFKSGHIKHVHQLQNLYFALTQKELELTNSQKSGSKSDEQTA